MLLARNLACKCSPADTGAYLLGRSAPCVLGRASTRVSSAGPVKKTSERRPLCASSGGGLATRCGGDRHRSFVHTCIRSLGLGVGRGVGWGVGWGWGLGWGLGCLDQITGVDQQRAW